MKAIKNDCLYVEIAGGEIKIDLTKALSVKLFNKLEERSFVVSDFSVGNVFPVGKSVRVHLVNFEFGLVIPVVFKKEKAALRAAVKAGEIVEQLGIKNKIMELSLLPELMTSNAGDDGWFMLPTFSGALVEFKDHLPTVNRDRIYMEQSEWEKFTLLNCFAMRKNEKGVLGIVSSGDFHCWVVTELNQNGKNRIYPVFGIRHNPGEALKQEDKEVVYSFSSGKEANYPEMAKVYRNYLIKEKGVSPLKERVKENPVLDYSVNAMRVKIFMGMKYPFVVDGSSPMQKYTTFEEAGLILDEMKNAGIKRAVVTLVGWNKGGHDGAYPTRFPVEPDLGGEEGLRSLIGKAKNMGYQIVPHDNVTDIYRAASDFDYEYTAGTEYGEALPAGLWGGGQSFKVCPVVYLDRYGYDFSRIKDLGFSGHYYMDAQSSVLWQCHSHSHPADEEQFAKSLARILLLPREMYGAVSIETPSAFSLPFIDEAARVHNIVAFDGALKKCKDDFQRIISRGVPFYQIAVHGLITYQDHWIHCYRGGPGGVKRGVLAELAFGARPSMEISYRKSPNGDYYKDSIREIKEAYQVSFEKLKGVHVETVESFEEIAENAFNVVYSNGVAVSVNFGDEDVLGLKAMSFKIDAGAVKKTVC